MFSFAEKAEVTPHVSPKRERKDSTSPESFAGFSPKEIMKKKYPVQLDSPPIRVSKPRTSKSRAALVWKKAGTLIEETIKVEPVDDNETTVKSEYENNVDQTDSVGKGKRMKKQIAADTEDGLVVIDIDSSKKTKTNALMKLKKQEGENKKLTKSNNSEPLEVNSDQSENCNVPSTSSNNEQNHPQVNQHKIRRPRQMKKKAKPNGFKCDQCGRKYKYLRGMRQHKKLECNKEPQFPCPYCPSRYRYRQNIREHVRNFHEQAFPKWYATHYVVPMLI